MTMYEVGVATPLRCMKCNNAMSSDGQRIKWRRNIAENFNRLSRMHECYRQTDDIQTDGQRQDVR